MVVTGNDQSTGTKTYPSATVSTTNLTRTDPRQSTGLREERLATVWSLVRPLPLSPNARRL